MPCAEPLTEATCRARLPGYAVEYHYATASTSDEAAQWVKAVPGVVVAAEQLQGRGTRGKSWISSGGLTATFIFDATPMPPQHMSLIVAVLVRRALAEAEPETIIKWPNDLLIGEGKLCGLLCERRNGHDLIGVGINVGSAPPVPDRKTACITSVGRGTILEALGRRLSAYPTVAAAGFRSVCDEYHEHCAWNGKRVMVVEREHTWCGTVEGINADGFLLIGGQVLDGAAIRLTGV